MEKHSSENKIKLRELEKKYDEMMEELEKKALEEDEKYFEKMRKKGNLEGKKIISKAKVSYQNEILVTKSRMLDSFNEYLLEKIQEYIESDNYDSWFLENLEEAGGNFSEDDKLRIIMRENDRKYLDGSEMTVEISDEVLGGFYIIANEKVKYDYSIEGKIMEASDYIGCLILKLMTNKAGEGHECK
ncbi:hypothetical protein [Dethiosulfatibacter aminovorans]|uniref:hypothetical protein n=1 Tax=Dethiosulfatibacter aminovorans TaxID=332095 RepID=UPI0011148911|nr:hypothetical protein [Dethiosulfatibacter aminovorans]